MKKKIITLILLLNSVLSAESLTLKSITGKTYHITITPKTINIQEFPNKTLMIDFFSTTCPPCIEEFPELVKLQNSLQDSLQIIGIQSGSKGSDKEILKFAQKHNLNYPIINLDQAQKLINFAIEKTDWVGALPYKLLYHPKGTLSYKLYGVMDEKHLLKALGDL
jgi:thiol-disulfide isomerase/thioredoxin